MAKSSMAYLVGAILIIVGLVVYLVEEGATITTFAGTFACNSKLIQQGLHNITLMSNSTMAALLQPCANASALQNVGIILLVIGIVILGYQYYNGNKQPKKK